MDAQFKKMMDWRQGYFSEKEMLKECVGVGYVQQLIFVQRCKDFYVAARAEWLNSRHDWRVKQRETAAALAAAEAEIARLRAGLAVITKSAEFAIAQATKSPQSQHLYSNACGWSAAAEIAARYLEPQEATNV